MPLRIEDYALIGDTHTVGLVGRDGSIDWLCLPRFDSGAVFAALLGNRQNGRWLLAPAGGLVETRREYRRGTLVLDTYFTTDEGTVRVTDCMPHRDEHPSVLRIVEGLRGRVHMNMELILRFDYGWVVPWVRRTHGSLIAIAGPDGVLLRTPVHTEGRDMTTAAEFTVTEGQRVPFSLTWFESNRSLPPKDDDPHESVERCARVWRGWSSRCKYKGPYEDAVVRSLVTLKALTFEPTGGILAAATTSLPEQLGGVRNWDYRYCWLRDATFTLQALIHGGYSKEAACWRDWLIRAVAGDPSQLQIMYGAAGERRLEEVELEWLSGYEQSKPVRIGNAAAGQFQLDVYGELMDAMHLAREESMHPTDEAWEVELKLMEFLEGHWREPDEGIWEVRGGRQHFTYSKVMAWVAFDRAVKAIESCHLPGDAHRFRAIADEVHREVCERGFNQELGSFTQSFGSTTLDASLLQIPLVGFLPASDQRVRGTLAAIERELVDDIFVARYDTRQAVDGLPAGEGAFLACSFWLVDNLVLAGDVERARRSYERLLGLANDVGLIAEEFDVSAQRLVGNFPQAFSHIGVVNSAVNLAGHNPVRGRRRAG